MIYTIVGTSLFRNYQDEYQRNKKRAGHDQKAMKDISSAWNWLETQTFQGDRAVCYEAARSDGRYKEIRDTLKEWVLPDGRTLNCKSSAELDSLSLMIQKGEAFQDITLLCSDTLTSCLMAEILSEVTDKNNKGFFPLRFNFQRDCIQGLQVRDLEVLKGQGFKSLIERFMADRKPDERRSMRDKKKDVLNITGGYKGVIPEIMLIAELFSFRIVYKFEKSNDLIEITVPPIRFDWKCFECLIKKSSDSNGLDCWELVSRPPRGALDATILDEAKGKLTETGKLLWDYYLAEHYNCFWMTDTVYKKLMENERQGLYIYLQQPLQSLIDYSRQHHLDGGHTLFTNSGKDGGFNRVYYCHVEDDNGEYAEFIGKDAYYIYQVFGGLESVRENRKDHDAHEVYLENTNATAERKSVLSNKGEYRLRLIERKKVFG